MPLPNPIGEYGEELEPLIPGITPIAPSILPGIPTNKPLFYQTDGTSGSSEKLNLIEPKSQPSSELSLAATDAFIINKPVATNSIHSVSTATQTNSNPATEQSAEVDPLIGGSVEQDSSKVDPLTNPGTIAENNASPAANQANLAPAQGSSNSFSPANLAPAQGSLNSNAAANPIATASDASSSNAALQTTTALSDTSSTTNVTPIKFTGGTFKVLEVQGQESKVGIEFLSDGGLYQGELAIFSLEGMDKFVPGSPEFIKEAASRALSNSNSGYVVISDTKEGAKLPSYLPEGDFNSGEYKGVKTFTMQAGTEFGFMLVPNGTIQFAYDNPSFGGDRQPLFSMATANPDDAFRVGQIADVTGDGSTFAIEDMGVASAADGDYNDVIFRVTGAKTSNTASIGTAINPRLDWRPTAWGKNLIDAATSPPESKESIAANPGQPEQQKTETVGSTESTQTPENPSAIADSGEPATAKKETTVAGVEQAATPPTNTTVAVAGDSETLAAGTTVTTAEISATNTTETAGVGVGKSELPITETTITAGDKPATKATKTVVAGVGKSELPITETTTTETTISAGEKPSPALPSVSGTAEKEPERNETTLTDAGKSEPNKLETVAADSAEPEVPKPETSAADSAGFELPKTELAATNTVDSETLTTDLGG